MKAIYIEPQMIQVQIQTNYLISESTTDQDVWTDDPQDPDGALTKESNHHSIWDEEW
ncbi:MAG: hypothetical protein IKQ07_05725 [Bacteroidaceae bacterium]|nr:hypothetical protein [Bacteroidaceae bacterium]